jgi:uncharacterized protein (DUF488 family)
MGTDEPLRRALLFTIGHSSRSLNEFLDLLGDSRIQFVVDVRAFPRSRTHPQFNEDTLPGALAERGIQYAHLAALGGRRPKSPDVNPACNAYWRVSGFHNYADYALTPPFSEALARLRGLGSAYTCAIMCAEAVWWRCHRRIIADYLLAAGDRVRHIIDSNHVDEGSLSAGAKVLPGGTIIYPLHEAP